MNGIINVLKPSGMTSFDVIAYLRKLLGIRKIGHAGTLDPMAAGVLPVCAGNATKAIEFLMDKDKLYRAELTLGIATDTQDNTGNVISARAPECSDEDIIKAVKGFEGKYLQKPPMYSALKVGGKKLYELAREGIDIERQSRTVEIYSADVISVDRKDGIKVLFDIHCSKGTYIRTLCADIGGVLGCGGHMSFLLRKRAGCFEISGAVTLEELDKKKKDGTLSSVFLGVDKVFDNLPQYRLDLHSEKKFRNGMSIPVPFAAGIEKTEDSSKDNLTRVYGTDEVFIALGQIIKNDSGNFLKVKKFFLD
jgi:tRNA pseudouridine55 synthase